MTAPDVLVVGAGIVGAACADELTRAGLSVTIVDRSFSGGGTTAAGMGHVTVMDDSESQFALTRYSQRLWSALRDELPEAVEVDACGTIWVAASDAEMGAAREKHAWYAARGVATEILDRAQLAAVEPELRKGLAGGLRVPGDSVVYPPAAAAWFVARAQERGAQWLRDVPVSAVDGGGATLDDGTRLDAGCVVNAAGHDALGLLPVPLPGVEIRPRKGHLAITDRAPGFCRHQLVELGYLQSAHGHAAASVAFNVQPRTTGQILVGSSREYGVASSAVDPVILARMVERAVQFLPRLADLPVVRTWTGFRAATDDKLPLIGAVPGVDGLFLATGHEGLGITTSTGTARLIADLVLGRPSEIDREPFRVDR